MTIHRCTVCLDSFNDDAASLYARRRGPDFCSTACAVLAAKLPAPAPYNKRRQRILAATYFTAAALTVIGMIYFGYATFIWRTL